MANYKISNEAKKDLIRIHHYGIQKFGVAQADKYFNSFFDYFDLIAQNPYSFANIDLIKKGYRHCVYGSDSIYYKVNGNIVEIMTIVGRQDLNNIFFEI